MMRRLALCAVLLLGSACHRDDPTSTKIVVFAASSLQESFGDLARAFQNGHPAVHVALNFAGSQQLRLQIEQGARADVFASADRKQMQLLVNRRLVVAPEPFATNELVIAVSKRAATTIRSLAELPRADHIVLGTPEVPVGEYAARMLERAGRRFGSDFRARVERRVASRELNTRQVLAKVTLGEADAAIVYRTDVAAAHGAVQTVPIPPAVNVVAVYPIAVTRDAAERDLARQWVSFVLSAQGQHILVKHGLGAEKP